MESKLLESESNISKLEKKLAKRKISLDNLDVLIDHQLEQQIKC